MLMIHLSSFILLFLSSAIAFYREVKDGFVAIKFCWGKAVSRYTEPGYYYYNPLFQKIIVFDVREKVDIFEAMDCYTGDSRLHYFFLPIEIRYRQDKFVEKNINSGIFDIAYLKQVLYDLLARGVDSLCIEVNMLQLKQHKPLFGNLLKDYIQLKIDEQRIGLEVLSVAIELQSFSQVEDAHDVFALGDSKEFVMNRPRGTHHTVGRSNHHIVHEVDSNRDKRYKEHENRMMTLFSTNLSTCSAFAKLDYIPADDMHSRTTPLILSFPGSGDSFLRVLIERVTGYYTGSVATSDIQDTKLFPGDASCGVRMSAINSYPDLLLYKWDGKLHCWHKAIGKKCNRGLIPFFSRFLILSRDPYEFIYESYKSHVVTYRKNVSYNSFVEFADEESQKTSKRWNEIVKPTINLHDADNVMVVRYEELVYGTSEERLTLLKEIMFYIKYPFNKKRAECAFALAESPLIPKNQIDFPIQNAYRTRSFVCKIWQNVKNISLYFNYVPWNNQDCDSAKQIGLKE
jgi:hypothetical protein